MKKVAKVKPYDPAKIESKWQKKWESSKVYKTKEDNNKPKYFVLDMFPYPSGEGLHVGHPKGYIATDIISRYKRMTGHSVLHPMGFDAFGLPAENYALKTKTNPADSVKKNVARYKKQLEILGFDYDWAREVNTTDPKYYKWTQWIFLKLLEKGLAYESFEPINWCPSCKTGLANEDVEDGKCERCGTVVEKKPMRQWVLKITDYAERLLSDLDLRDVNQTLIEASSSGEPCFMQVIEPGTIRPDLAFVERKAIAAIVKHWSEEKYIGLVWKKVPWKTFITGGVEKGQSVEEAAFAEVREETGYQNIKFVKNLGKVNSKFFHVPKGENRFAHFDVLYLELKDGEKVEVSEKEKANHDVVWVSKDEIKSFITPEAQKYMWSMFLGESSKFIDNAKRVLDWPESIKILQKNWIGKSEGAIIKFKVNSEKCKVGEETLLHQGYGEQVEVFTTRPDTLFGVTYVVLAPEHKLVNEFLTAVENRNEVEEYIKKAKNISEIERTDAKKEKTGVELKGIKVINPANNEVVPLWIADYVLPDYGTGAVMAVPAHDERDWEFAKKFGLGIKHVVVPYLENKLHPLRDGLPVVKRNQVSCILRNPKDDKYAYLEWNKEFGWVTFIGGGIEEGENAEQAVRREILEESGYKNIKIVKEIARVCGGGCAAHKNENRFSFRTAFLCELIDEDRNDVTEEEKKKHEMKWVNKDEITRLINVETDSYVWDIYLNGFTKSFIDEGYLINSGKFNSKNSEEVKKEITESVGGKWVIKYKLRDWVFSRQRYWGEPIPVIHCSSCYAREKGLNAVIVHGCSSNAEKAMNEKTRTYDKHWIKWTANQLEKIGIKVANPYMPTPWAPSYESWKQEFEKLEINENSILIGHSCGTAFLVRWLGETKRKVNSLILVAPWKIAPNELKKQFYDFDIDRSIKERVKNIYAFTSNDEEQDGKESLKIYSEALELKVIELKDHGHFTMGDMGTVEFPELKDLISSFSSKIVPVPEKDLPVILPKVKSYEPTGTGESPLAAIAKWVNVKCPVCKSPAKRETNTMPQWAGSSWYYLRYLDPKNNKVLASKNTLDYWCGDKDDGVDLYVGGAEHATRHLIYARFWHKFLYDIGVVSNIEPFLKLQHVGLIMGEDGRKMSKRFGNVINPDEIVKNYGADSLRLYEMFMGPFDQQIAWSTNSISGVRRFIEKVWRLREKVIVSEKVEYLDKIIHKTIKKVTEDIESMRYNTAISSMMIAINEIENAESISKDQYEIILKLLAPFAPHFTEELWGSLGNKKSIHVGNWPQFDPSLIVNEEVNIMVQVNGKVRGSFTAPVNSDDTTLEAKAKEVDEVKKWLDGKMVVKVIVVPKRLVNIVVA
jgi:leucyl-tRNA synthetase